MAQACLRKLVCCNISSAFTGTLSSGASFNRGRLFLRGASFPVSISKIDKSFLSGSAILRTKTSNICNNYLRMINGGKSEEEDDDDLDKPIQFTTSKAAQWKATDTLSGDAFPEAPWYQPYVVLFSVGMFMLYFFVMREENDIDERISQPLWEKVPGLEKQQLNVVLEYNRAQGLDTKDIERRLLEIEREEKEAMQRSTR